MALSVGKIVYAALLLFFVTQSGAMDSLKSDAQHNEEQTQDFQQSQAEVAEITNEMLLDPLSKGLIAYLQDSDIEYNPNERTAENLRHLTKEC